MIHIQNAKWVVGLAPVSTNSGTVTPLTCDTLDYNYATMIATFGVIGSAATVFKIQESTTDFSGADITAFVGVGTTGDLRLPQTTDAGKTFIYHVDMNGIRKRYLQMLVTTGSTTLLSVQWALTRANIIPITDTNRGVAAMVIG